MYTYVSMYGLVCLCVPASSLEAGHIALESTVYDMLQRGMIPFVVGGSNDQSYPNASALMKHVGGKVRTQMEHTCTKGWEHLLHRMPLSYDKWNVNHVIYLFFLLNEHQGYVGRHAVSID